ncbi:MAG: hypothetical protein LBP19_03210 [Treponema sp.]|jgi:hypothetical protein|nr:hypothetical protein [Treponema sp.]
MNADTSGKVIAQGYNCFVRARKGDSDPLKTVGYVTSFQATEDFQVQEAICVGNLGPVAIDPQGYTCTINIGAFITSDTASLANAPKHGADAVMALQDNVPDREDFMEDATIEKFAYLEFINKKNPAIPIAKFTGVLITSNGVQSEGNAYVRTNVSMRALSWNKD